MTALSEALLAAQRQAIAALSKAYVAETIDVEEFILHLDGIGCTDKVDRAQLVAALEILRTFGGSVPQPTRAEPRENEPASERQMSFIAKLADEKGLVAPSYPLTKSSASEVIAQMQSGRYVADEWAVPF